MSIKLDLIDAEGNRRSIESAVNIAANTRRGIEKAWWRTGKDLIKEFNTQVLAKNKTGRLYIRKTRAGRRLKHIASAPGETPANITGNYRRAIGFRVRSFKELIFGNSAEYAGHLEKGTSRMKKRPGLSNTVSASERNIIRNLSTEIADAI